MSFWHFMRPDESCNDGQVRIFFFDVISDEARSGEGLQPSVARALEPSGQKGRFLKHIRRYDLLGSVAFACAHTYSKRSL